MQRCDRARRGVGDVAEEALGLLRVADGQDALDRERPDDREVVLELGHPIRGIGGAGEDDRRLVDVAAGMGEHGLHQRGDVPERLVALLDLGHDHVEVDRLVAGGADEHQHRANQPAVDRVVEEDLEVPLVEGLGLVPVPGDPGGEGEVHGGHAHEVAGAGLLGELERFLAGAPCLLEIAALEEGGEVEERGDHRPRQALPPAEVDGGPEQREGAGRTLGLQPQQGLAVQAGRRVAPSPGWPRPAARLGRCRRCAASSSPGTGPAAPGSRRGA